MEQRNNKTYRRIVDAAERLFSERGYAGVSLPDIAKAVNMRHASLYYYVPEGKEQLYLDVMERSLRQHREGLTNAIIEAGDEFRAQIHAISAWFASHPPMDLGRMVRADMPQLAPENARKLTEWSLDSLRMPISAVIRNGVKQGYIVVPDINFAAMGLLALVQSIHNIPRDFLPHEDDLVEASKAASDMMLDGWYRR